MRDCNCDLTEHEQPDASRRIVQQLETLGYARVRLREADASALLRLREEACRFFRAPASMKRATECPEFQFGYRPFGRQYSVEPGRPDLNESFTYWGDDPSRIRGHHLVQGFTDALHNAWAAMTHVTALTLDGLAERFDYTERLEFRSTSYIETNWYFADQERDLLQDRHEDGHLLTVLNSNRKGLELELEGAMTPIVHRPDEVVLMPGSLLEHMTGGWVPARYHQVRNHRLPARTTLLFLANPPFEGRVAPYVVTADNANVDIAELARSNGQSFGLPRAPEATSGTEG